LAVAGELKRRIGETHVLFVTGRRRMETEILKRSGYPQVSVSAEGLKGMGWGRGIVSLVKLPLGLLQSLRILDQFGPDLVLGVGGYSSGPVCLAAWLKGIPTAIHEQNSFPGLTNRLLCRIVDAVFISFEESRSHFPGGRLILTGNPVRKELLEAGPAGEDHPFTILVTGGSQGARAVNRAFVEALEILKRMGREPDVIHQTGELDYESISKTYQERGLKGEVHAFIRDMARAYSRADIVVGRAGATTVSELSALGKPSILIPYPHAANDHQVTNARVLTRAGGAEMILERDLSGESLARTLLRYMEDPSALKAMGEKAAAVGSRDAAVAIADHLLEMIGRDPAKT